MSGMNQAELNKVLQAIREAQASGFKDDIAKSFSQSASAISGITYYDLEQGARLLYPVTTIFRNMIPRDVGGMGIQANWRAVTAVNPGKTSPATEEGKRGGAIDQTTVDKLAAFAEFGLENYVTWSAEAAAKGFDNIRSLAATQLLHSVMEAEERLIIGGNRSTLLGTAATPAGTGSTTGGTLSAQVDWTMYVVALTYDGVAASTVASGVRLPYTRTNTDGSTSAIQGFMGKPSAAAAAVTTTGATSSIAYTVTPTTGAFGYAWYFGRAGSERLAAITSISAVTITANTASPAQLFSALPSTDTSTNSLMYDGLFSQIFASGSGAYFLDNAGAALTTSGSGTGGISQIDTALQWFYDNYRLVPTDIFMNGTDQRNAKNKILTGNTNLAPFFLGQGGDVGGGAQFKKYNNPIGFGNQELDVHVHPFIPQGTIMFYSRSVPYQLSNVSDIVKVKLRYDYRNMEWPMVTKKYEYGVYFDGVLQNYFPPAFGMICNIANG